LKIAAGTAALALAIRTIAHVPRYLWMASDAVVDKGRRRFLTATTAVVGGAGLVAAVVPFVKSW
jgi:hypothetical protein